MRVKLSLFAGLLFWCLGAHATRIGGNSNSGAASQTASGVVTTGAQDFAGAKTFYSNITCSGCSILAGSQLVADTVRANSAGAITVKGQPVDGAAAVGVVTDTSATLANATAKLLSVRNNTTEKTYILYDGTHYAPGMTTFGATSLTLKSTVADGAATVAHILDTTNALSTTGAKLFSLRNAGVEKIGVTYDGSTIFGGTVSIGNMTDDAGQARIHQVANYTTTITARIGDGAGSVAVILNNSKATLSTAGAKLLSVRNNSTEKVFIDKDGSIAQASATLQTCASTLEGLVSRDTAAGGTSTHRTRLCMCTSDGAGTPAYAWMNITSGTVGNTTTCAD